MGLLTEEEYSQVMGLLCKIPNCLDTEVRRQLLIGMPESLKMQIIDSGVPQTHFTGMVNIANENSVERYEEVWPIVQLIKQAIARVGQKSPVGSRFQILLEQVQKRAEQWEEWSNTFTGLSPQDTPDLERLINAKLGMHSPVDWRTRMYQAELATCLICFKGCSPEGQGTGFLIGPNLLITNYHVMEDVMRRNIKPKDVRFCFDYKTFNDSLVGKPAEYGMSTTVLDDRSPANALDYILIYLDGNPGADLVEGHLPRGWLKPVRHRFQSGEPLFIIQHPDGGPLKFAFDRVNTSDDFRISYLTNTGDGSSGAPCFNLTWDLVALHQGVVRPDVDPQRPNRGIPFSRILEQPRVQEALGY